MTATREELKRGWTVILAAAVGFGLGLGSIPVYTNAVFVEPLGKAFGWSVAQVQIGVSITPLCVLILSPLIGIFVDRIGGRLIGMISLVLYGLAFMAMGLQTGSRALNVALWVLVAVAGSGTTALVWTRIVSGWFSAGRGLAMGMVLTGTGVAGMLSPPFTAWEIGHIGWRASYGILGALPILVGLPLAWLFLHDRVRDAGPSPQDGLDWRQALRRRQFWLMGFSLMLVAGANGGLIPNAVKLLVTAGFGYQQSANLLGVVGLFVILGRVSCGALLDRFWPPAVCALYFVLPTGAALLLLQPHISVWMAFAAVALIGLAAGAEFAVLPFLVGRYFGLKDFGVIVGLASVLFYFGQFVSPIAFGRIFDVSRSYHDALKICAVAFLLSSVLALCLGRYPATPRRIDAMK